MRAYKLSKNMNRVRKHQRHENLKVDQNLLQVEGKKKTST